MSTAVLISGQMRTFAQCFPSQRWQVYRHFPEPHFFITVQDNPDAASIDVLRKTYGEDHVHVDLRTDPDLTDQIDSEMHSRWLQAPYANAAPTSQLLLQHWYQNEVWKLFAGPAGKAARDTGAIFDTFIRIRPDLWFHSMEWCRDRESWTGWENKAHTPWWGKFGGVNDRFAILGRDAAQAYFTVYDQIPALLSEGCPFHPESLVFAALQRAGIDVEQTLQTEFTTLRKEGPHRPPEITGWDIAHAALRSAA